MSQVIPANLTALQRGKRAARPIQRGFMALTDMTAWIGVAILIVAAVLALGTLALRGSDGLRTEQELNGLRIGTVSTFSTQPEYGTADMTTFLSNSGDVPDTLKRTVSGSSTTLTNKWGGAVSVVGAGTSFNVNYAAMPKAICNKIVSKLKASDWRGVSVGGVAVTLPASTVVADATCTASNDFVLNAS